MGFCLKFYLTHDIYFFPIAVDFFLSFSSLLSVSLVFDEVPLIVQALLQISYLNKDQIERPNVWHFIYQNQIYLLRSIIDLVLNGRQTIHGNFNDLLYGNL